MDLRRLGVISQSGRSGRSERNCRCTDLHHTLYIAALSACIESEQLRTNAHTGEWNKTFNFTLVFEMLDRIGRHLLDAEDTAYGTAKE